MTELYFKAKIISIITMRQYGVLSHSVTMQRVKDDGELDDQTAVKFEVYEEECPWVCGRTYNMKVSSHEPG